MNLMQQDADDDDTLLAGTACSAVALVFFSVVSGAVVLVRQPPGWMGWLWLLGGAFAAVGVLPSLVSGLALVWRRKPLAGAAIVVGGLVAPWWWFYGVMATLSHY